MSDGGASAGTAIWIGHVYVPGGKSREALLLAASSSLESLSAMMSPSDPAGPDRINASRRTLSPRFRPRDSARPALLSGDSSRVDGPVSRRLNRARDRDRLCDGLTDSRRRGGDRLSSSE